MTTGGQLLVACLEAQGVDRVFCVPGESYLDALNGLYDSPIETITARQEGGAAMMAEADGKMTGRPGICFVTRGPGATNAAAGVHIAQQDSTPMILFVGQIGRYMRGRDAFQEVDYRAMFGGMTKWVEEIDRVNRIPEIVSHAFHIAMSGRPGPVVITLPEDMLRETCDALPGPQVSVADPAPNATAARRTAEMLAKASRPILVLGGTRWSDVALDAITGFAARWQLPVGCSFRRQSLFDAHHPNYAGDVGLGINPALRDRIANADLVLLLGARFSENPSQSFSLLDIPRPRQTLIHVHPGAEELGRIYIPDLSINATPETFLEAMQALESRFEDRSGAVIEAHTAYQDWTADLPAGVGEVTMSHVIGHLRKTLPDDAMLTNGAGNYAIWLHRYYRYKRGTQLAPISGSMGYGLPAAIAAACRQTEREIWCLAGDGCFQMTAMDFGAAAERGLKIRVLVCDNQTYGTIGMHQDRAYPGRAIATQLVNPDFAAWAKSYGALGITVSADQEFAKAVERARAADGPALIHLKLDLRDVAPGRSKE